MKIGQNDLFLRVQSKEKQFFEEHFKNVNKTCQDNL